LWHELVQQELVASVVHAEEGFLRIHTFKGDFRRDQ
jgi:hypothetical protein